MTDRPPLPHPDDIPDDEPYCPICDGAGDCCPLGHCPICDLWYETDTTRDGHHAAMIVMHAFHDHLVQCGLCLGQGQIFTNHR